MIFINQIREKIGVMFGNPETTTGGRALKFYSSVRLDIRRTNQIKEGEEVVGSRVKVKVVKNKVAAPFRQAEFDVGYGEGISKTGELLDIGIENKIIEKSGSWFSYGDVRLGQGRENAKLFIKENADLSAEIEVKVRRILGIGGPELTVIEGGEPASAGEAGANGSQVESQIDPVKGGGFPRPPFSCAAMKFRPASMHDFVDEAGDLTLFNRRSKSCSVETAYPTTSWSASRSCLNQTLWTRR